METANTSYDVESSQASEHNSARASKVSRRRFLAASGKVGLATAVSISGIGQVAGADTDEHNLFVQGLGERATYSFAVGGNLEKDSFPGASVNSSDTITNNGAKGVVSSGGDAYTFTGDLLAFNLNGGAQVSLDGEAAHVGSRPDHFLQIHGTGSSTDYTFSVDGNLQKSTGADGTISEGDEIFNNHRTATGQVHSGTDAYTFDRDLLAFEFGGAPINVLLNGQAAHVGQNYEHLLQIQGTGSTASYNFTVSGRRVAATSEAGGSFDSDDRYELNEAWGGVTSGADVYRFNGHIRAFDLDGKANVLLDGQPAHVGQIPDHV